MRTARGLPVGFRPRFLAMSWGFELFASLYITLLLTYNDPV